MITAEQMHPQHRITVTGGGPFGRAWFECSCGIDRVFASKHGANTAALRHHGDTTDATFSGPASAASATVASPFG